MRTVYQLAPSRSWASVDDTILYGPLPRKIATPLAKNKRAEVSLKTVAVPFGEVEGGLPEISAPCMSMKNQDEITKLITKRFEVQGDA
jgi:hypothetical protein